MSLIGNPDDYRHPFWFAAPEAGEAGHPALWCQDTPVTLIRGIKGR